MDRRKDSRREERPTGVRTDVLIRFDDFNVLGVVSVTGRQRQLVPGRRTKDGDRGSLFQAEGPKTETERDPGSDVSSDA